MTFRAEFQKELIEINSQLDEFKNELRYLRRQLHFIRRPATAPNPILKPKGVNAMSNIASCLRREIDRLNQDRRNEHVYEQLPYDDSSTNRELKSIMGNLLRSKLPQMYGKRTWYHACRSECATVCEEIVYEASEKREFYVLTQTANLGAIRLIADSKMRTALRDANVDESPVGETPLPNRETDIEQRSNIAYEQVLSEQRTASTTGETTRSLPLESIRDVVAGHMASNNTNPLSPPNFEQRVSSLDPEHESGSFSENPVNLPNVISNHPSTSGNSTRNQLQSSSARVLANN